VYAKTYERFVSDSEKAKNVATKPIGELTEASDVAGGGGLDGGKQRPAEFGRNANEAIAQRWPWTNSRKANRYESQTGTITTDYAASFSKDWSPV
jgi:hypothetical protein